MVMPGAAIGLDLLQGRNCHVHLTCPAPGPGVGSVPIGYLLRDYDMSQSGDDGKRGVWREGRWHCQRRSVGPRRPCQVREMEFGSLGCRRTVSSLLRLHTFHRGVWSGVDSNSLQSCFNLPNAGIIGVHHHTQLMHWFLAD